MRDLKLLVEGTSPLDCARGGLSVSRRPVLAFTSGSDTPGWKRVPLEAVEDDVYGKLARRRRKAQMAARRQLGVHDDMRRP